MSAPWMVMGPQFLPRCMQPEAVQPGGLTQRPTAIPGFFCGLLTAWRAEAQKQNPTRGLVKSNLDST